MLIKAKYVTRGVIAAVCAVILSTAPVAAAPYGQGAYNNCTYACTATTPAETKITLSSGLVVTINLTNGQKIPHTGYVVIVKPADGQTGTLHGALFYINGVLQFSGEPNETGAVRWLWQPGDQTGDVRIKIVITAQSGSVSTQEFTVSIGTPDTPAATTPAADSGGVLGNVSRAVLGFVGTLPTPVIYGVPYFLFALLFINIILLLVQTQRELREIAWLQRIITRERQTGLEKNTFVSLASHYLRTPMSIIQGGFDLLARTTPAPPAVHAQAQQLTENLRLKIDSLLARSDAAAQIAGAADDSRPPHIWKSPGLYLPIVLIGLCAFAFNYIAANVKTFNVGQLNIIMQIVAFALLSVVFYQVFRRRQLRRRDTTSMQQALAHEQAINQTRDELITESTQLLGGDLRQLASVSDTLPQGQARQFIQDGITRFRRVLAKFAVAAQLKGGRAEQQSVTTSLPALLDTLPNRLTQALADKRITLQVADNTPFTTKNPQLVGYVLASLIDNALAYSPSPATIELHTELHATGTAITVTDHGPGISPQKIALLFQPFSQTQDAARFTHEGMGFSLYLDKLIMTYLGGDISLASKPGVATTATIVVPH